MPRDRRQFSGEPLLRDVFSDPIVLAVMAGDGTTTDEVEILIATIRRRLTDAAVEQLANVPRVGQVHHMPSFEESGALGAERG